MGTRGSDRVSEPAGVCAKRQPKASGGALGFGAAAALRWIDEAAALSGTDEATRGRRRGVRPRW